MIKRLSANTVGRDFVCGDMHGAYSCVQRFMKEVQFDPEKDRMICAGDLVDRGPENEKCLALLFEPWFFATKGNHEELIEGSFAGSNDDLYVWVLNGGQWGVEHLQGNSDLSLVVRDAVRLVISKMPYLITVEKRDGGLFHVIHAELFSRVPITDEDLTNEKKFFMMSEFQTDDGRCITWGRFIFMRMYKKHLDDREVEKIKTWAGLQKMNTMFSDKLSMIYSGHTPVRRPVQFYGQTNLDTMAYASYYTDAAGWEGLTFTEPATGKFWLVNDREFKQVEPVVIT